MVPWGTGLGAFGDTMGFAASCTPAVAISVLLLVASPQDHPPPLAERLFDGPVEAAESGETARRIEGIDAAGRVVGVLVVGPGSGSPAAGPLAIAQRDDSIEAMRWCSGALHPWRRSQPLVPWWRFRASGSPGEPVAADSIETLRTVERATTLLGLPAPTAMVLAERHARAVRGFSLAAAGSSTDDWLAEEDRLPTIDLLDAISWLEVMDARQCVLRAKDDPANVDQADRIVSRVADYLRRLGRPGLADWVRQEAVAGGARLTSFTISPEWPCMAWQLRDALVDVAVRHRALVDRWQQTLCSESILQGLPDWLKAEVRSRAEDAARSLPLGLEAADETWREIRDHLEASLAQGRELDEARGREEARTAVWECWGRLWSELGAVDTVDRVAADRQHAAIADQVSSAIARLARDADQTPAAKGAAETVRQQLSEQFADRFSPWTLLPFDDRVLRRVSELVEESITAMEERESIDALEIESEARLLAGQVLVTLSVDFADSARQRARLVPFADVRPGIVWSGGRVRPLLSRP